MNKPKFFYSRNCQLCQYLAENVNITWNEYFDMVCIDSKEIRDKIVKSKNVKINKVPCILVQQVDEKNKTLIHKYEGEIVREWIIQNILKPLEQNKRKQEPLEEKEEPSKLLKTNKKEQLKPQPKKEEPKQQPKKEEPKKKLPLKSNLKQQPKKSVKFDLPVEEKKEEITFIDEEQLSQLKKKKTTLKERLEPIVEEQEEIEPLVVEVVDKQEVIEEDNPYISRKKDVKGTSAVLLAAKRMMAERDENFQDENENKKQLDE